MMMDFYALLIVVVVVGDVERSFTAKFKFTIIQFSGYQQREIVYVCCLLAVVSHYMVLSEVVVVGIVVVCFSEYHLYLF